MTDHALRPCLFAAVLAVFLLTGTAARGQTPPQTDAGPDDDLEAEQEDVARTAPPPPALADAPTIDYYVPKSPENPYKSKPSGDEPKGEEEINEGPPETLPYSQWDMELAAILGMSFMRSSGVVLDLGASYDIFVIDSLAPGLETWYEYSSDSADAVFLLPFLKWVFYRSWDFAPYIIGQGGRAFVLEGGTDAWLGGGGVGFMWFFSEHMGLEVQLKVLGVFYDQNVCFSMDAYGVCSDEGDTDVWVLPSLGIAFLF